MSKGSILAMMAMASAMSEQGLNTYDDRVTVDLKPKRDIIPRPPEGATEYFFNANGEFSTESMLKSDTVFKCYARNDKNAKRKFKNSQKQANASEE